MPKTFRFALEVLKIAFKANGKLTLLIIFATIYQNTFFPFLQVFILSKVLDLLQKSGSLSIDLFLPFILLYIIFGLINSLLITLNGAQRYLFDAQFETYLDRMIIFKLSTLDPATFEKPSFQNLLSQTQNTRGTFSSQIDRVLGFVDAFAKILTAAFVLLPIFPFFIPLVLVSVIPSFYFGNESRKKLWPFFTTKRISVLRITEYIKELLSQENTSKEAAIFKTGNLLNSKVFSIQKIFFKDFKKTNDPFIYKGVIGSIIQLLAFAVTQYLNLIAVIKKTIGIGQFTLIFQQTLNLAIGSQGVLEMYSSLAMRTQTIEKFFEFLNYKQYIISPVEYKTIKNLDKPAVIEFKNVSFKYPKTERFILKDFNFKINPGEKIALVGENGAGKTTIIKLLLRFYDATEGEILVNDINIKDLNLDQWHKMVGALFQDFIKYQFTFKENVYFGNLNEKDNEKLLKDAIFKSGADKYVSDLPDGINQVVGKMFDGGIDLSGGQWQKLALARAFFRNSPILILDEPTSAIDAKAEYEIFENVQKLQKDKTVIIISHRFSTVRNADRILVLDEGKIIEEGNHEKLMDKKGLYAELFELQARGYK